MSTPRGASLRTKEEFERIIAWIEERQELLRGKQVAWHKEVKEEVFPNDVHITKYHR